MDEKKNEENPQKKSGEENSRPKARRTRGTASTASKRASETKKEGEKATETPSNLAESVAYLKSIGLKKVSNRTFINETDLAAFLEEDFTNINKVRALGFIQILEREYPVDLQELRQKYLEYYAQNRNREEQHLFVTAKNQDEFEWKRYMPWIAGVLLLGGVIWYLFGRGEEDLSSVETEQKTIVSDLNSEVVEKAKENLKALEAAKDESGGDLTQMQQLQTKAQPPQPQSDRAVPFVMGGNGNNQSSLSQSTVTDAAANEKRTPLQQPADTATADDLDLDAMVREMVEEYNLTDETAPVSEEANRTEAGSLASAAASVQQPEPKKAQPVKKAAVVKQKAEKRVKKSTGKKSGKSVAKSKLYIVPAKKSWVGVIYLDDYTKKDYLIRKRLYLNPARPQLIVVGQKEFEIFNNGYSYRFRGKGPVRFVYKNGDIMEINNREFKRLSKGAAW